MQPPMPHCATAVKQNVHKMDPGLPQMTPIVSTKRSKRKIIEKRGLECTIVIVQAAAAAAVAAVG